MAQQKNMQINFEWKKLVKFEMVKLTNLEFQITKHDTFKKHRKTDFKV